MKGDSPGQRLRMLRHHLGKYQVTFAREFGISGSTLSRYEMDIRQPDIDFFILLRSKTGIDLNWLFLSNAGVNLFIDEENLWVNEQKLCVVE